MCKVKHSRSSGRSVTSHPFFYAIALGDQSPFEDDPSLLVPLVILGGKLVDPAQLGVAILARHVADHVAAGEHHSVLHLTVVQVDHFIEQKGPAGRSREAGTDQLRPIRQDRVATGAREQSRPSNVIEENATHRVWFVKGGPFL